LGASGRGHGEIETALLTRPAAVCAAQQLLDQFVGAEQEGLRDGKRHGLGGLDVDDQLQSRRSLHWQVRWLFAAQYTVDVSRRLAPQGDNVVP
jgi:hypothetical protein